MKALAWGALRVLFRHRAIGAEHVPLTGGVVLASACDLRIAADSARFAIPEIDLGLPLTWGGIPRLARDIGAAMTKELVLTCRPFDADEARAIGFLNRVVPEAELDAAVDSLAASLEQKSSLTLEATKRHANAITDGMVGMGRTWNDADSLVAAQQDPESRAAAAAYLKKLRSRRRSSMLERPHRETRRVPCTIS